MENKQERNKPELEDLTLEEFSIEELEDRLTEPEPVGAMSLRVRADQ